MEVAAIGGVSQFARGESAESAAARGIGTVSNASSTHDPSASGGSEREIVGGAGAAKRAFCAHAPLEAITNAMSERMVARRPRTWACIVSSPAPNRHHQRASLRQSHQAATNLTRASTSKTRARDYAERRSSAHKLPSNISRMFLNLI